jgi:hypothetical protein
VPTFHTHDPPPRPTPNAAPSYALLRPVAKSQATVVLAEWYATHADHPFPTPAEKATLMADTGLTAVQLR